MWNRLKHHTNTVIGALRSEDIIHYIIGSKIRDPKGKFYSYDFIERKIHFNDLNVITCAH